MAGVNKWTGVGNCCADPEMRVTASGGCVTNITVACNDKYKDKQTGQMVDKTEFVRIVFFNRLAEIAGEYLKKGSQVYVEGSLRTRKWQDQSGQDRYTTEIVGSEMQMLGGRAGATEPLGNPGGHQGASGSPPRQAVPMNPGMPSFNISQAPAHQPSPNMDSFDPDIPF